MRQLTLVDKGILAWQDVPEPVLSSTIAAIVQPDAVAVCDFDRGLVSGRYTALPYPIAPGRRSHPILRQAADRVCAVQEFTVPRWH